MNEDADHFQLQLNRKQLVALYMVLTESENGLDAAQRGLYRQICDAVYSALSVEELENVELYYRSL